MRVPRSPPRIPDGEENGEPFRFLFGDALSPGVARPLQDAPLLLSPCGNAVWGILGTGSCDLLTIASNPDDAMPTSLTGTVESEPRRSNPSWVRHVVPWMLGSRVLS